MKKIINIALLKTFIGTSVLLAGSTQITSLGVTPGNFKYQMNVGIKVIDNNGDPLRNGAIQMNPTGKMSMYAMDLSNIDKGEYVVKVRHSKDCEEKKIYHETIVLRALRTQDNISNNSIRIPVDFDCREDTPAFHFETEHPYSNNTNITKTLPPLCPIGTMCIALVRYAHIRGETEAGWDFITISQNGTQLGKFSGLIDEKIFINSRAETVITFSSDSSITKEGVIITESSFEGID